MREEDAERRRVRHLLGALWVAQVAGSAAAVLLLGCLLGATCLPASSAWSARTGEGVTSPAPWTDVGGALIVLTLVAALCLVAASSALLARRWVAPVFVSLERRARLTADVTHDLRAPIARLHTRAQLLLRRAEHLPGPVGAELRRLVQGSADLADVVDDVLRAADLRPATADPEPVDLVRLVAEVLDAERPRLRELGLHPYLVVAGPGWLPVEGVRTALRRAFSALADNAVAHTPPGGNVTVTVCADVGARFVEVAVRDDGRGFDPRHSRRLFARSVHGSAGSGRRHGIGLALVREIVESHGGTVTAYGCPGAGARFVVRLPLAREPIDGVVLPEARCPMRRLLGKTAA